MVVQAALLAIHGFGVVTRQTSRPLRVIGLWSVIPALCLVRDCDHHAIWLAPISDRESKTADAPLRGHEFRRGESPRFRRELRCRTCRTPHVFERRLIRKK